MQKMVNSLQNYAWGSKTALTELYNIANPTAQPMAEMWMGAHPKSPSRVDIDGEQRSLRDVIEANPLATLGEAVVNRFGELPFLFKVLCAEQPLSIQVHPSKEAAEQGFARENLAGIPLDAANRNYKDANHKPELVYALTPFQAINGFRERAEIVELLKPVEAAHPQIARFIQQPDEENLAALFATLLSLDGAEKALAIDVLKSALAVASGEPWQTIQAIAIDYPEDTGLFSPLLLNVVTLQPGEAMFLYAETPHAYLKGIALEVMANSDNVLRAGLTPKYIDVAELLANVKFHSQPASQLLTQPQQKGSTLFFPIPVEDFAFSIHTPDAAGETLSQQSAAILFCVEGEIKLIQQDQQLSLQRGESCFVAASEGEIEISGHGRLARVFNLIRQS